MARVIREHFAQVDRQRTQAFIKRKYTARELAAAKRRLCDNCTMPECLLLPLTTRGENCPYFAPRAEATSAADTAAPTSP